MRLSAPSVVFAEASWYGSLRGGLHSGSGGDGQFFDGGSRWGIKGSAEASEGLTAVYRFEHKISTTDGGQPGGRLAYAGLSGGFGTITVGQIWNAAYNHAGAITDKSYYFGDSTTGYRHGNALSYAFSSGPVSFQMDLISDGSMDTGQGIDKTEFGVTVDMGEIGKVALAHTTLRDEMVTKMTDRVPGTPGTPYKPAVTTREAVAAVPATPDTYRVRRAATAAETAAGETGNPGGMVEATMITVHLTPAQNVAANVANGRVSTAEGIALIQRAGNRYFMDGASAADCTTLAATAATTDDCVTATAFVSQTKADDTVAAGGGVAPTIGAVTENYHFEGTAIGNVVKTEGTRGTPAVDAQITPAVPGVPGKEEVPARSVPVKLAGHKNTHVAIEFNVGGVTPYVGYSVMKTNMGQKLDLSKEKDDAPNPAYNTVVSVPATETKTTHYGVSGGLGDTGINFLVAARSVKPAGGEKSSPWLFNVSKSLGGGATVIFEHANDDDAKKTKKSRIGLHVSF